MAVSPRLTARRPLTREIGSLEYGDQKPVGHNLPVTLCSILQQGEYSPAKVQSRHQIVHWHSWKEVDEWQESYYISDHKYCLKLDKFIAVKVELFRHSGNVGIICSQSVLQLRWT